MKKLWVSIYENYTWNTRKGQDFGFDTLFFGLVDENYGQNRRGTKPKYGEIYESNSFQGSLIFQ